MAPILPLILGLEGPELSDKERDFFQASNPLGFILFTRNCETRAQIKKLTDDLKKAVNREHAPILIDQEGGRVTRLKPPIWRPYPVAKTFSNLIDLKSLEDAAHAAYLNAYLTGLDLQEIGVTMNCAPVADMRFPDTHEFLSERCYGDNPDDVIFMAQAVAQGHQDAGICPVIKHLPGHGRATCDSHLQLPHVSVSRKLLEKSDFKIFKALHTIPFAMTAHIIFDAIDPDLPATLSPKVIQMIREDLQIHGIIISDDVNMKALQGTIEESTLAALQAGCDVVLHCNGKLSEMEQLAASVPMLPPITYDKWIHAQHAIQSKKQKLDPENVQKQLAELMRVGDMEVKAIS